MKRWKGRGTGLHNKRFEGDCMKDCLCKGGLTGLFSLNIGLYNTERKLAPLSHIHSNTPISTLPQLPSADAHTEQDKDNSGFFLSTFCRRPFSSIPTLRFMITCSTWTGPPKNSVALSQVFRHSSLLLTSSWQNSTFFCIQGGQQTVSKPSICTFFLFKC
jgi:hypothetical protein